MAKKIGLMILGILVLAMAELLLSVSGKVWVFLHNKGLRTPPPLTASTIIVCVGDSHTFGIGTSARYSYPQQLQELLNRNNPAGRFCVVNLGLPGDTTRHQVERLEDFLKHSRADLVIWLTGRNNDADILTFGSHSILDSAGTALRNLRLYKAMAYGIQHLSRHQDTSPESLEGIDQEKYRRYMEYFLNRAVRISRQRRARLMLLSYYGGPEQAISDFAQAHRLVYGDCSTAFSSRGRSLAEAGLLSPDGSHLNHLGYALFAQQVYTALFVNQRALGCTLEPCVLTLADRDFYASSRDIDAALRTQQKRIAETNDDPFEIANLGHIYTEIGRSEEARQCYDAALRSSGYSDNNALVAPLINWYVDRRQYTQARAICQEIIDHNPVHTLAQAYMTYLQTRDSTK